MMARHRAIQTHPAPSAALIVLSQPDAQRLGLSL